MIARSTNSPCNGETADLFTLSLLLAEGQIGMSSELWPAFIDQLSSITDAFANARADRTIRQEPRRVLVSA